MPKRRNPFGECSPLQLKQHVAQKEVDLGVAKDQNMKSVYERTRDLLFSGSKRSFEVPKDANCNDIYVRDDIAMEDQMEECPRQLHITPSGQLANMASENKPTNAFDALMSARRATGVSSCQCCKGQAASQSRCGFCDKSICYDCVRPCMSCQGNFCQLCSVMNPDVSSRASWCCQRCACSMNPYTQPVGW